VPGACRPAAPDHQSSADGATAGANDSYPHAAEPVGSVRDIYDGVLSAQQAVNTYRNTDRLFATRRVAPSATPRPLPPSDRPLASLAFTDRGRRFGLDDYLALNRVAGLLVLDDGRIALERYRFGNSERTRWMSMSVAKSITSTLVGAALHEGRITALADPVTRYAPALAGSSYEGVTVRDVLTMSSGVRWREVHDEPDSDRRRLLDAQIAQRPGSALAVMERLPRAAAPGTAFNYSTGETLVAAAVLRGAVGMPLAAYLSNRIWTKAGMEADAFWWLDGPDGLEMGGTGFGATLRDYGRFGLFVLDGGLAGTERILPAGWMEEATTPLQLRDGRRLPYGYLWWLGASPADRRDRAFAAMGLAGQFIYVNPAARVVIVVWGAQPVPGMAGPIDDWAFFGAVAGALRTR
jgi:CubicO group peptidase (beta-lactamase class C family)